jgi:PAS domain S-box-containing protein
MQSRHPVRILMVDDRQENLLALEVSLSGEKYEFVRASSGKEALRILLQDQDFAIILMDVQMPVMDGFETAELIRASDKLKHVPIIFLTATTDAPEAVFKGYRTGAVDYMVKPLNSDILRAKVSVFAELYKKTQELIDQRESMKELNAQLNQQTKYVRSLIEATLDPIITIDTHGIITDMNEAVERITGLTREQIKGTPFVDHFTRPKVAEEVYRDVFDKGIILDNLLTIAHIDGKFTPVLCNGSVYRDDSGKVMGAVIVAREKILSRYSRSLIEASLDPLITINFEGKITDLNEALVQITGIEREKITGTDFFDYFTEPKKAREVYEEVFDKGFVMNFPLTIKHKEGKLTDVLFNGSVYKDERGNVLGSVIVARDITEMKRFENELITAKRNAEEQRQKAEDAVKAKQQFLSNMSHEIRTPMNAIIGFTKVVLKTDLTEKQREYINAIKLSGDALIVLINDILDLAKVDAGKMTFEKIPFKLAESVSAMLHLFETKLQEKNLQLRKEYDRNIPEVLLGDPVRLHQIVLNLVSNATKFTTEGNITVKVKLKEENDEQVVVRFDVSDTGIGIPESKLPRIFDNFQQASSGTARLYGGTGLGLAIVKQLVEAQGGKIWVKSKVGVGSTFTFELTFKKTKIKIDAEPEKNESLKAGSGHSRILVVEDVKLNQLLMRTLLEDGGFTMDIAENGKIAIDKLKKDSYDVILMDLQMPVMNGFEATGHIRKELKLTTPIIALTADVTSTDVEKCKAVGMDDYISKPIDDKLLYKKLARYIRRETDDEQLLAAARPSNGSQKQRYTNLNYLKELTKDNPEMISEMLHVYLEETPRLLETITTGVKKKDWAAVQMAAHSLIPSFYTVGMKKEYAVLAEALQEHAMQAKKPGARMTPDKLQEIQEAAQQVDRVCNHAFRELREELLILEKHD